jgi:hypothetical protein
MKLEPLRGQAVGRVVQQPMLSTIVRPDETKGVSKFILLDAVGPDLAAKGIRVGDVVLPMKIHNIVLNDGSSFRPLVEAEHIMLIVRDWKKDEFHVQTENGSQYVPFDDPRAAKSLGFGDSKPAAQPAAAE